MDGTKSNKNLKTNKMKKLLQLSMVTVLLIMASCTEDENITGADIRDEFVGNWLVLENSNVLGVRSFEANIVKSNLASDEINISNFYKLGESDSVKANVSSVLSTTFIIPIQLVSGHSINGTGALSGDEIEMVYYVDDGNEIDTISAVFTRDVE